MWQRGRAATDAAGGELRAACVCVCHIYIYIYDSCVGVASGNVERYAWMQTAEDSSTYTPYIYVYV